jgi:epsilon-lactone hydrolase
VNKYTSKNFGMYLRQRSYRYFAVVAIAILSLLANMMVIWVSSQSASAQTSGVWNIGSRVLPPPVGVSNELREAIANTPTPDIEAAINRVPKNLDEWRANIARHAEASEALAKVVADKRSIKIEPDTIAGVSVYRLTPPQISPEHANHLFVYIHGGAFVKGGGVGSSLEGLGIAAHMGIPVISVDYRMAPDFQAPTAMNDIVSVWQEVIKDRNPDTIALGGTSAGANLTLVSTLRMKDLGLDLPGALFVGTPPAFLDKKGDMRFINEGVDRYLFTWDAEPAAAMELYVGDMSYEDPYISPFYGDVEGFPPTYLISGTRDLMLSDTVLMHRKLRRAGVEADLHVYEGHSHGDYALYDTQEHLNELNAFLRKHLK